MKKTLFRFYLFTLLFTIYVGQCVAQINPSIYTGIGTYTNLGGAVGLGSEIKYKCFSVSAAIGGPRVFTKHDIFFDVGTKIYSNFGFFGGLNYGYITSKDGWFNSKNDYYGFTVSVGYRQTIYKHIYGLAYLGVTSDYLTFMPNNLMEKKFIPRLGLIFGYEF